MSESVFPDLLRKQELKLKEIIKLQDAVFRMRPAKFDIAKDTLQQALFGCGQDDIIIIANILVEAAKARTSLIEHYARMIKMICETASEMADLVRRLIWRQIQRAEIQFLVVHLLENGVFTIDYMLQRVRLTKDLTISEELVFYFFPEWSTCPEFFSSQIENSKEKLAKWDKAYTQQCETKLDGQELAKDGYKLFKDYRRRGLNHNGTCRSIRLDDIDMFKRLVAENEINVNSNAPRSLFERNRYGKQKTMKLVEYCAFYGSDQCLMWLLDQKAKLTPNIMRFALHGGNHDIINFLEDKGCSLDGSVLWGLQAYHFSCLKRYYESNSIRIEYKALIEMFRSKYKGAYYLMWKREDLVAVMNSDPKMKPEDSINARLMIKCAKMNDVFLCRLIHQSDEKAVQTVTSSKYKTAVRAAVATNAVDVLRFFLTIPEIDWNHTISGDSLLSLAARENAWEALHELTQHEGVDVNLLYKNRTPLMVACERGSAASARVLLCAPGIDVNKKNGDGRTAHDFCEKSGSDVCKKLLAPYTNE